jgi:DNA-binding PadR family transcriptional regulator
MIKRLLLLGLLSANDMHGYRLHEYANQAMGMYTDIKKSTIYYTLDGLEKEGYIEQEIEREGKRPERRVYRITSRGREYFLELLRRNLVSYNRTYYDDDIGIAFVHQLTPQEAHRLLAEKREQVQQTLKELREQPKFNKSQRYVVSHNIAHLEADLAWIYSILMELDSKNP